MKSIIQEASSIAKAIEQGLEKAGNPKDFSVKILEYPEKNFFRMTTRSAKIALYWEDKSEPRRSLEPYIPSAESSSASPHTTRSRDSYADVSAGRNSHQGRRDASGHSRERGPKREDHVDRHEQRPRRRQEYENTARGERNEESSQPRWNNKSHDVSKESSHFQRSPRSETTSDRGSVSTNSAARNRSSYEHPEQREHPIQKHKNSERGDRSNRPKEYEDTPLEPKWHAESSEFAHEWLSTVFRELERSDIMIAVNPDGLLLRVMLDRPFTSDAEKERKLFASLALLLLEAVKRKFRLNLRGHKVVISHH